MPLCFFCQPSTTFQNFSGWEETKAQWEPIIDRATFDRVQKMLDHNCSRRKTHPNKYPFTVTGLLVCKECGESMAGASATGGTGKRVGYYEHLATRKNEASLNKKLLAHKPRRIPAAKIEPAVWDEVKKFVMSDEFVNGLLIRAKSLQGVDEKDLRLKELDQQSKALDRQISVLAERIAKLPEAIDPQPLIDQLGDLQKTQKQIQKDLKANEPTSEESKKLIELEDLKLFRKGLSELIGKGELDLEMRSKIIKLIVHKIEIMKDGFEIHFHVGEALYKSALGDHSSSASFFVSFSSRSQKNGSMDRTQGPKNKKAPEVLISEAIKSNLIGAKNFLHFQAGARSSRLTNGGGRPGKVEPTRALHASVKRRAFGVGKKR